MALSMCYVAKQDTLSAIRQITKGLIKFPKFVDGYVIRGQLYN